MSSNWNRYPPPSSPPPVHPYPPPNFPPPPSSANAGRAALYHTHNPPPPFASGSSVPYSTSISAEAFNHLPNYPPGPPCTPPPSCPHTSHVTPPSCLPPPYVPPPSHVLHYQANWHLSSANTSAAGCPPPPIDAQAFVPPPPHLHAHHQPHSSDYFYSHPSPHAPPTISSWPPPPLYDRDFAADAAAAAKRRLQGCRDAITIANVILDVCDARFWPRPLILRALQLAPYSNDPALLIDDIASGAVSEHIIEDREMEIAKSMELLMREEEDSKERARRAQVEKEHADLKEMLKREKEERERMDLMNAKVLGERLDREEAELRRIAKQLELEERQAIAAAAAAEAAAREKEAQEIAAAAAAAAARVCGVCNDDNCNVADCVQCSAGHIVCKTCFALQIASETGADVRDAFVRNGCNITCAFCKVPFRERDFVSVVSDEAFDKLKLARDEVAELRAENRLRGEFEARVDRLRQELARGQDAHTQKISRHRLHIAENILTLKCPRANCGRAFLDYTGCMALYCQCGCGFCAWCLADCATDAHSHVLKCPRNLQPGGYGGTLEQFNTAHRNRVGPLVLAYLATVPQTEIAEVRAAIAQDLRDLGIAL